MFLKLNTLSSKISPLVKIPLFSLTLSVSFLVRFYNPMTYLALDRMPPQIGNFIAQTVYTPSEDPDSEPLLRSSEYHPLAEAEAFLCHFVNVPGQQISQGTSWKVSIL